MSYGTLAFLERYTPDIRLQEKESSQENGERKKKQRFFIEENSVLWVILVRIELEHDDED